MNKMKARWQMNLDCDAVLVRGWWTNHDCHIRLVAHGMTSEPGSRPGDQQAHIESSESGEGEGVMALILEQQKPTEGLVSVAQSAAVLTA
eukprot:CAMPEP_0117007848 /NCGR_PEP_ID=MMETSP0472-20121206/7583_1 /TAXON_ID=693140 ORGANISM="Tiarina fusus, Strain LIS" /NCGR_SAMPLE_ID=MMETSP0472 /ASSEMBLY_ACC=CAM_ASM_000603 /LENGTH=89 /DNA_ID=CAMNT_0004709737 /DNA_START=82 /DNA_END=347 /DNA_ORIENTATION=+